MHLFELRNGAVRDHGGYVRSFLTIRDERIRDLVESEMEAGFPWPDTPLQLRPAFEPGEPLSGRWPRSFR